jgi:hypothetical protein
LFRRGGAVPANAEYEIIAVDDPLGAGGTLSRFQAFRRPLATANFHIARNVGWHDQDTDGIASVHDGLTHQASGNITGAQQGAPASPETIEDIVAFEKRPIRTTICIRRGLVTSCGASAVGKSSAQPAVTGRFNLFDLDRSRAWIMHESDKRS